jgi:hypothetical protein
VVKPPRHRLGRRKLQGERPPFARQGFAVWLIGLLISAVAAVLGGKTGERYHRRIDRSALGGRF